MVLPHYAARIDFLCPAIATFCVSRVISCSSSSGSVCGVVDTAVEAGMSSNDPVIKVSAQGWVIAS